MTQSHLSSTAAAWARFRFAVVGSLLSSPRARGALKTAIAGLAQKTWTHPVTGREVQFSAVTIERWYYTALHRCDDPVAALRRAVRKDCGQVSLATALAQQLLLQYRQYPHWSYQLHYDNLAAGVKANPSSGRLPSYSTVKRYMQAHGWSAQTQAPAGQAPGPGDRRSPAPDPRASQLRGPVRRSAVAPRLPPRLAQGAHPHRGLAAPDRAGHPRRPLATLLPRPVVPR